MTTDTNPGAAYAALPDGVATLCEYGGDVFTAAQMRAYADATHALRAPHGQAPAQQDDLDAITLLAECRDAFPVPERGSPIENEWMAACSDPSEVPGYMRAIAGRMAQSSPAAQGDALDAERLDWLALAGPVHICLVIDREHDGEIELSTDDVTGYGKTLREAIDAARAAQEGK